MEGENRKALIENEYPEMPRPAVAAVVVSPDRRILMVKRGKPPAQDMWSVPGGSIELGETVFESAKREVLEETGIVCNPKRVCDVIDAIYRDESGAIRFHYVIVYVVAGFLHGRIKAQDDAVDAQWLSIEEISGLETPGRTLELLQKIKELQREQSNPRHSG